MSNWKNIQKTKPMNYLYQEYPEALQANMQIEIQAES